MLLFFNKRFDSKTWKGKPSERKRFIKQLIKDNLPIDKTKEEIRDLFGTENNLMENNRWSYFVYKSIWNRRRNYVLALYFKDNRVVKMEIEYRYKKKFRVLGT